MTHCKQKNKSQSKTNNAVYKQQRTKDDKTEEGEYLTGQHQDSGGSCPPIQSLHLQTHTTTTTPRRQMYHSKAAQSFKRSDVNNSRSSCRTTVNNSQTDTNLLSMLHQKLQHNNYSRRLHLHVRWILLHIRGQCVVLLQCECVGTWCVLVVRHSQPTSTKALAADRLW